MVHFKTTREKHVTGVVRTLEELYGGRPVGSVGIGEAYGMQHRQVLKYLHKAKDAGLVKPVFSDVGGAIRGWVPGSVESTPSLAEQKAMLVAEAVGELHSGKPVSGRSVARHLDKNYTTIKRWLRKAYALGLVRKSGSGWTPA